jgi:SH3-like domain-containing protein
MKYVLLSGLMMLLMGTSAAFAAPEPSILNPSGLPIPRFVSFKSAEVNVRVGPGKRYPIRWVYRRAHLPVEIIEEFAHWRKIRDFEGTTGWVHKGMVDGKRMAMILDHPQNLYARPDATSAITVRASANVIGRVKECQPDWCQLEIETRKAWIRKADIWGVSREEVFRD